MKPTLSSLLALAIGAISLAGATQAADTSANADTQSVHRRVPPEPGKGSPADADYARAKEACQAKSGDTKTECLNNAKAAYQREKAVNQSATRNTSQGENAQK